MSSIKDQEYLVQHFLKYCMPFTLDKFLLNWWCNDIIPIRFYLQSLKSVIKNVRETVILWSFEITNEELISLLSSCSYITGTIGLVNCRILTHEIPQFPESLSLQCSWLSFNKWDSRSWSDWGNHPEYLDNLIKGISQIESLRNSLESIENTIDDKGRKRLKDILKSNKMGNVKVTPKLIH